MPADARYDLKPMRTPRTAGPLLDLLARLLENPLTGSFLARQQLMTLGLADLRRIPVSDPFPVVHPLFDGAPLAEKHPANPAVEELPFEGLGFRFESAADLVHAYRSGQTTPLEVAERVLSLSERLDQQDPAMRIFIAQKREDLLAQGREATERYRHGAPLGPLDGVPVAVKDELDQVAYPTTVGTRFLGKEAAQQDAECVARLRAAGAMLIGKTNMHEIGLGVTGMNPHHGTARNPYDPRRFPGGSSSGSAVAVAAGLCPVAVGADAGGSIRIPAALCGVVGLKPTFGRVSEHGAAPVCWSVAHLGPIAATVRDAALAYLAMAGPDPKDRHSLFQPAPHLAGIEQGSLKGVRLGVFRPWFEDAEAPIVAACDRMIEVLKEAGAEIVPVEIPELGLLHFVHSLTTVGEMLAAHQADYARHPEAFSRETRVNFALMRHLRPDDVLLTQRHRARLHRQVIDAMRGVDALITPATACTARPMRDDALAHGESDLGLMSALMRYTPLANLTGLPAITFPAGYDPEGMPIGFQVIGHAWEEAFLLRVARVAERQVERRAPVVHHRLLGVAARPAALSNRD